MKKFISTKRVIVCALLSFFILSISFDSLGQEKGYVFQSRGVPANPNAQTEYLQPDGSSITIQMQGDAVVNWATTIDGYTLLMNNDNGFEYAVKSKNDDIVLSGLLAQNPDKRRNDALSLLTEIKPGISYSKAQVKAKKENHIFFNNKGKSIKGFPTTGTNNYVLILANFNNTTTTYTQANFDTYMNAVGNGSFSDYYLENSYGQLTIITTVTIWVTLPNTHNYYGPSANWGQFAYNAIQAADPYVNYTNFDNDGDGVVDGIGIIHQGRGQEESSNLNDIWSHSWDLASAGYNSTQRTFDGILANAYTTQPEMANALSMTNIGVMCHEFGHTLGAPDYYDTDYGTNGQYDGTGNWDLMAGGAWNNNGASPAHHNGFTKWFYYGWVTPITISTAANAYMANVEFNQKLCLYTTPTANEYFLLENRQQIGFDSYLPGHGLIIYHVDQNYVTAHFITNDINASSHQGMYPKAANGTINSTGCPFPGATNKTSFTDTTTPNSKSWAGVNTGKPITNITESLQVIYFTFMGGGGPDPVAEFTVDKTHPINSMNWANFTDQSTNFPTSWLWTITPNTFAFMNPTSATSQNPTVSFTQPGAYTVTLQATNSTGSNSITKTDYIHVGRGGFWTGATSTNWNTGTNWENHEVPPSYIGVSITPAAIFWPTKTGNLTIGTDCQSLNMSSGFTKLSVTGDLTIANGTNFYVDPAGIPDINIDGSFINYGTFTPGYSVVKMNGNTNSSLIANTSNNGNLTTSYNGGWGWNSIYFDISAMGGKPISVNNFDIHINSYASVSVQIWYAPVSYLGNTNVPGIWTQLGTTQTVNGNGITNPTFVNPGASVTIPSGLTYGFFVSCYSSSGQLAFSSGPNTYSNTDISIYSNDASWTNVPGGGSSPNYCFNGTVYYSYPIQNTMPFWDLEINKTNASVTTNGDLNINNNFMVKPGAWFSNAMGNNIYVTGNTNFEANSSGTASFIDNGVSNFINFQPNVESYISQNKWHLISAPINNAQSIIFNGMYLMEFLESTYTWNFITTTNYNLITGRGFMVWSPSGSTGNAIVNYNGPLNNGDINVTGLSYTISQPVNNRGWNMVGNPYPSATNWNSNWARTNIDATAYIYNNGNYVTWNGITGTHPNGDIAPGQGFFVKANATGAALTIPQSERKHSTQIFYKNGEQQNELFLTIEGNGFTDKMIIQFNDEATAGFDNDFDAWKLKGDDAAPQLYSVYANNELTVNTLPFEGENMIVPINFEAGANGQFTISIEDLENFKVSSEIWLEDLRDDKLIDLMQVSSYGFSSNTNDENNRFLLHFGNPMGTVDEDLSSLDIYSFGDMIYIQKPSGFDGKIDVYDMLGQKIISKKTTGKGLENIKLTSGTAYYFVKIQFGNKLITEKVFIK